MRRLLCKYREMLLLGRLAEDSSGLCLLPGSTEHTGGRACELGGGRTAGPAAHIHAGDDRFSPARADLHQISMGIICLILTMTL